jgi:hypothetical protein
MALNAIRLAFKTAPGLSSLIQQFKQIEKIISDELSGNDYGVSVKAIYMGVILLEPQHADKFSTTKPLYKAGKYELREAGLSIWLEDTLEFNVIPSLEDVRRATSIVELAEILKSSLSPVSLKLQRVRIHDFDVVRFVVDLNKALGKITGSQPSRRFPIPKVNASIEDINSQSDSPNASARSFAKDALAFVEHELSNVRLAVEQRRGELLQPIIARSQAFLDQWRMVDPSVIEACSACAYLVVDVVREGGRRTE